MDSSWATELFIESKLDLYGIGMALTFASIDDDPAQFNSSAKF